MAALVPTAWASKIRRGLFPAEPLTLVKFEHRHECLLRNLNRTDPLHPLLAFLLLFQQLPLAGDVAAIALGKHVLPHRRNRLAGDHLAADGRLQRHDEHLPRNDRLEPVSYTHLRAHETRHDLVCRLLLEKKKKQKYKTKTRQKI